MWCWKRLLRVPWTARRSKQSILKEISPEYSLEGLMLSWNSSTLATWCKELTHWKRPWFWERLKAGEGDDKGWDGWIASPTQWTWVWVNSGSLWWTWRPSILQFMGSQRVRHDWGTGLNWTEHPFSDLLLFSCSVMSDYLINCSTPGFPILHHLLEFAQTHVPWVGDAIQPSHPLLSPSPAFNLSQHQGLFQRISFQHQSFQWIFRTDFL